jgi:hypothetical protein
MAHETVKKSLIRISKLQLNLDTTLIDLQSQALSALTENICKLSEDVSRNGDEEFNLTAVPETIEDFVLREAREDMDGVPGRSLWIRGGPLEALADPAVAAAIAEPRQQIANPSSGAGGKKGKGKPSRNQATNTAAAPAVIQPAQQAVDKNTIRRLKLNSGSRKLVLSTFSIGQKHSTSIPPTSAFYLWLFAGRPANSEDPTITYTHWPSGPAINILLSGGATPSLPQLKRAVESEIGVSFSQQRIFKFFPSEHLWKDLNLLSEKKRSASGIDNLLAVPFSLKEGDILCVVDSSTTDKAPVVDTAADIRYRAQIALNGDRKNNAAGGKKKRPQEVMLRLAADDFSSEDEGGINDHNHNGK